MQIDGGHVVCWGQWTVSTSSNGGHEDTCDLSAISSPSEESTEPRDESSDTELKKSVSNQVQLSLRVSRPTLDFA